MKHLNIDQEDERVKQFVRSLAVDIEGALLELEGRPLLKVLPPYAMTEPEKQALIAERRQLMQQARERNQGVPAKVIEREVQEAVDEVRRRKRPQ